MSRLISESRSGSFATLLAREGGGMATDFALVLPVLIALSLGILDFTLTMFEFHRAGESTRRGARTASIVEPVADLTGLSEAAPIICREAGGTVSCTGASVAAADSFTAIVAAMRQVLPALGPENVEVAYAASGVGDAATPGGIKPLVSVSLVELVHELSMMRAVPGVPHRIALPSFATTYLAGGYRPPAS